MATGKKKGKKKKKAAAALKGLSDAEIRQILAKIPAPTRKRLKKSW